MRLTAVVSGLITLLAAGTTVNADGPRSVCVETYRPTKTESCAAVAAEFGTTVDYIKSLNPGITCDAPINQQLVCLDSYTPTCEHTDVATSTNCQSLITKYKLTQFTFVQWNDNVNDDCSNLVVGKSYCVATSACWVGDTNPWCTQL